MRVLGELSEGAVIVPDVVDILVLPDEVIAPDVIVPGLIQQIKTHPIKHLMLILFLTLLS